MILPLVGVLLLFPTGAWAVPLILNIRVDDVGHSSVRVTWDTDIQSVNQRVQYGTTAAYGAIQGTYQQATVTTDQQMLLTGLAPNTLYHFCAQSTTDNIAWSACVDRTVTTLPLPAVHPEVPIAPAIFDTSMPAQTGTIYTVGSDCRDPATGLQHFLNVAVPGDTIEIPTTTTNCDGQFTTPHGFGSKQLEGLSDDTLTVTSHGYANGQIVRLGGSFGTPPGTRAGIDYYVIGATESTFQLSLTLNGSAVPMTAINPQMRVMAWPPGGDWIVVKTAKQDSELPPEGVRVDPSWAGKLALLTSTETGHAATAPSLAFGILAHHYRFVGLELTHSQTAAPGVFDPLDHAPYAITTADTSYVIFDRCYFHGLGFPDRIWHGFYYWDGAYLGIINSYADNQDYWRPYSKGLAITNNATTLTVATGTYHTGYTDCRVTSPVILTIRGGAATGTGQMWMTEDCGIVADFPNGMNASCSICAVVTEANPALPRNSRSEYTVVPLGSFTLAAGRFTSSHKYASYELSAWNTEGSQFLTVQYGPGPYILHNNYIQGVGILAHFTDEGSGFTVPSDITVTRNVFEEPLNKMAHGPLSDGRAYSNRNAFEVKTGQRIRFEGNQIVSNFQEITPNGYAAIFVVNAAGAPGLSNNVTSDLTIRSNTVDQSSGGIQINGSTPQSYQVGKNMRRVLVENNLFKRIDGRRYSINYLSGATNGVAGVVLSTAHGGEDFVIQHNTSYINRGAFPCFYCPYARPMEGFVMRDNIFWVNGDSGYRGVQYAGPIDSPSTPVCPTTAKAALDCIMTSGPGNPSYTWKNNVLVPGFLTTGAGGVGDSGNLATAGLAALYAPSPATLVVPGATPAIREAAVVFTDSTGGNFALALSSPYKAVGSDGADAGYDRFALEAAQGIVKETHVTVGAGQAVLKFTAPDGVGCPVDVSANNFQTWTRTSDPGGSRNRLIVIDNLSAATNYAYRILCQSEQVKGSFLTKASDGSATTMLLKVKPAASIGVDHVVVQSGSMPSLGSATGSTPCSTGCTVSVPASRAQVLYYNVQLFNAANALLAQSAIQAAVPE